jgi:hypothetical protein
VETEMAPALLRCSSTQWDDAMLQFRHSLSAIIENDMIGMLGGRHSHVTTHKSRVGPFDCVIISHFVEISTGAGSLIWV